MKKLKKILIFLLILPICFVFGACKKNNNNNGGGNPPTQQTPPTGGGNTTPVDPDEPGGEDPVDPPVDPDEPGGEDPVDPPVDPDEPGGEDPVDPPVDPDEPGGEDPVDPPVDPDEPGGEDPVDPPVNPDEPGGEDPVDPPVNPDEPGGEEPIDPPVNPDGPSEGGDEPDNPATPTTYKVVFESGLPDGYEFLYETTEVEKEVGENVDLPLMVNEDLRNYFYGWYNKDTDTKLTSSISGSKDQVVNVIAKWNDDAIKRNYCSENLVIEKGYDDEGYPIAIVKGYTGSNVNVAIPQIVIIDNETLSVRVIEENAFKNSNVTNVAHYVEGLIVNANAFSGAKLSRFNFEPVYQIYNNAFENTQLESVELGALLNFVGNGAFANNKKLTQVDMSKVAATNSIAQNMFMGCDLLESVDFGNQIIIIGASAFKNCESLSNVDLSNIVSIGETAFANCVSLTEIVISNKTESMGGFVFEGCENISTIKTYKLFAINSNDTFSTYFGNLSQTLETIEILGTSIKVIPNAYFINYTALSKVVLTDSIERIEPYAFSGCESVETFNIPSSLEVQSFNANSISDTLWYKNLDEILYAGTTLFIIPESISGDVVIKVGTTSIVARAFYNNQNITSVLIPSSVSTIGQEAFANCDNLESVTFENNTNLTVIPQQAFYGCAKLTSINLEACSNVVEIGDLAFAYIGNIETLSLPKSLQKMGEKVTYKTEISEYVIDAQNANFATENGVLYSKAKDVVYLYPIAKTNSKFVVPSTVTEIKDYAFAYCEDIKYLEISSESMQFGTCKVFSFAGRSSILILSHNDNITCDESWVYVYNLLDSELYEVSKTANGFEFNVTAETLTKTNYFVKFTYEQKEYTYLLILDVSGETISVSYSLNITE